MIMVPGVHGLTEPHELNDSDFKAVVDLVYRQAGITLGQNKRNLLIARLSHRVRELGFTDFSQYVAFVTSRRSSHDELRQLVNAVTTNTTHFFREQHHFAFLDRYLRNKASNRQIEKRKLRIWCAASSTGQEPYSIAITLHKAFSGRSGWDVKILASDIDTNALHIASEGVYTAEEMRNVPTQDKAKFFSFSEETRMHTITPAIRKHVVFRKVNLIYDALDFHEPIDVIFCRNVMIYFSAENRAMLLSKLHRTLAQDGLLFLGHSESIPFADRKFEYVDTTVYRKRDAK